MKFSKQTTTVDTKYGQATIKRMHRVPEELVWRAKNNRKKVALVLDYDSMSHYLDEVEKQIPLSQTDHESYDTQWTFGDHSPEDTFKGLRYGLAPSEASRDEYRKTLRKMRGIVAEAKRTIKTRSNRPRRVRRYAGSSVDVPRYLISKERQVPMPVFNAKTRRADVPLIRLAVNAGLSCDNSEADFARMTATAGALADCQTAEGFAVRVDLCISVAERGPDNDQWTAIRIPIKSEDDPANPERLLSVAFPGLFRSAEFRSAVTHFNYINGRCYDVPPELLKALGYDAMISRSWSDNHDQRERLVGMVQAVIADPNAE